jgi:predicted PurR-regulated permease PerM
MHRSKQLIVFAFGVALALLIAYLLRRTLLLIYLSVVFAVVLTPAVDWAHRSPVGRLRPSRGVAILLLVAAVLGALTLFLLLALPPVISDLQALARQMPEQIQRLRERLSALPASQQINLESLQQYAGSLVGGLSGFLADITSGILAVATVTILTAYLILDGQRALNWVLSMFPPSSAPRLQRALGRASARMRRWLVGQAMLMLVLGTASLIVFGLLGLRYYYLLAVFAGVANIVPLLGPVLSAILAGLVAIIDSPQKLLGVVIFFVAYQQVENAYLTPRIMKSQVQLSSAAVVVALMIGGALAGIPGAVVAVPSAVLFSELVDEYARNGEVAVDVESTPGAAANP